MGDNKFNTRSTEPSPLKKDFNIPAPGVTKKPTIILSKVGTEVAKRTFINTGTPEVSDKEVSKSKFNQPVYSDLTFHSGEYTDQNNQKINYAELKIDDVLVTVMNTKNIIETTLQGRNGTVKEYISDGDYTITIQGKLYGKGMNNYPQDDVQKLHNICRVPQSVNITATFLKMFDISDIVIKSYTIDQLEGIRNYQPFVINCVSDYPLILLKNA